MLEAREGRLICTDSATGNIYRWYKDGLLVEESASPYHYPDSDGFYGCMVSNPAYSWSYSTEEIYYTNSSVNQEYDEMTALAENMEVAAVYSVEGRIISLTFPLQLGEAKEILPAGAYLVIARSHDGSEHLHKILVGY
jgi:hypothetical protein